MGPIVTEAIRIGLNHLDAIQKQQPHLVRWHARDKSIRIVQGNTEASHSLSGIERLAGPQGTPIGCRIVGVPPDLGNQSFGCEARRLFDSGPDHGTE